MNWLIEEKKKKDKIYNGTTLQPPNLADVIFLINKEL